MTSRKIKEVSVMLTLDKIYHAAFVLKDVARKTDLIEAPKLSKDCQLYLKTENLQAPAALRCGALTIKSASFLRRRVPRASLPALRATMRRGWRWPLPGAASAASSVCRTAHP